MGKIQITIHKDGTQKIEAIGYVGPVCTEKTGSFERRLGVVQGERVHKPEYEMTEDEIERDREQA